MSFQNLVKAAGIIILALVAQISFAQTKVVTGKVTDSKDGSGIAGASVSAKGSRTATQTSADGSFSLSVDNAVTSLIISYVGFNSQEVLIGGQSSVSISLVNNGTTLGEVVVIGYGTVKKKDLTGSVTQVGSKDFQKGAITTPEQLIAGKVAGVSVISNGGAPGSGSQIRIRGGASLTASNDPLIVIDGVPISNDGISGQANALALINPNDIETFNILKDASATAIYGARASNGVILITTKKGKSGKPAFSFNTQLSVSTLSEKLNVLSPGEFREFVKAHGTPSQVALMGSANTDWQDEIYHTAISSDNNLSVAGSIPHMPYRISLGYLNQNGILRTGKLSRISASVNLSPSLFTDHLKINLNVKGSTSESRFANEGAIGSAATFDPSQPVKSGTARYGGYWQWLDNTTTTGLKSLTPRNPVGILEQREDNSEVRRSIGNMLIDYKLHFFPDLHINLNLGYDISQGEGTIVVTDSAATEYKRANNTSLVLSSGSNNKYLQKRTDKLLEFYLNYVKDFKAIQSRLDVVAGYSYQDFLTTNYNYADFFFNNTKRDQSEPNFPFDKPRHTLISFYGRANFSLMSRYLFTATVRRDASSRFSEDNRWGLFPSAAFAWRVKDEKFMRNSRTFSDLKFRIGYGITGQQELANQDYGYLSSYSLTNATAQYQFGNAYYFGYRPGGYDAKRKWEETATFNVGVDFGFMNNRLSGSLDYYHKKTKDLLNLIAQPAGTNFSAEIISNVGDMKNDGVELSINTQPVKNKKLTWDLGFNITWNKNEITNLTAVPNPNFPGNQQGNISGGTGNKIQINSVGYNRFAFFVFQQVYDANGNPVEDLFVDQNGDGTINEKDLYRYKGIDPDVFLGMSTSVTFSKWTAGVVMRASVGNYVYNNVASSTGTQRNILNPLNFLNNGSRSVLETNFTGAGSRYFLSDYYVQNASFLKMDNLNVTYNFGKVFGKANLRANANVQNVFVITKYDGIDPEISSGIDNNFYPRPRIYSIGLGLDF